MDDNEDFKNDPEAGENTKKLRLPFALCKAKGIKIQDWWTPRDAWNALKRGGEIDNVSDEYADYYRKLKKERQKQYRKQHPGKIQQSRLRSETKKRQLSNIEHNADKNYQHQMGFIAGAEKSNPMTFEQANSGHCNPFFGKKDEKTGVNYIGYRTNCQTCVATYIARRQGYDVRALPNLNNRQIADLSFNTALAYKDINGNYPKKTSKPYDRDLEGWLSSEIKQGDIFSMEFSWKGRNAGHIITAEKLPDGSIRLYDPQTNQIENFKSYKGRIRDNSVKIMNLTNCTLDESFCDKIMKKSEK